MNESYQQIQQNALKEMELAVKHYQSTGQKNSFLLRVENLVGKEFQLWKS